MSVRKRSWSTKKGAREAWLVDYVDQQGKRSFRTFERKKDADAYHATVRHEVRQGIHTAPSRSPTVTQAAADWTAYCEGENLERSTIAQYKQHVKLHIEPRLGNEKIANLTRPRVESFRDKLLQDGLSRPLAKKVLTSLKSILSDAQRRGNVAHNAAAGVSIKRDKRATHKIEAGLDFPTREEVKTMIDAATGKRRALLVVAAFTGLRASEIRGLGWKDVDFRKAELHVRQRADRYNKIGSPKSKSSRRTIPFGDVVSNTLKAWKLECGNSEQDNLVFATSTGAVEHHANMLRSVETIMVDAGVKDKEGNAKYGLHAFRHFYASWCLNPKERGGLGLQPNVVQDLLGHSSIVMTNDVYGHLFPRSDDRTEIGAAERALLA